MIRMSERHDHRFGHLYLRQLRGIGTRALPSENRRGSVAYATKDGGIKSERDSPPRNSSARIESTSAAHRYGDPDRMNSRAFVTTLLLPTLLICRMPCAPAAESLESLRTNIEKMRVESGVASIAVAVSRHGRIVWEGGFGWANREKRIPATQHTLYSLASISKPITATALMTLVEAGRIDLDAPINNYLGDAKLQARVGNASDATVRRVANHSAGLPEHYQFFFADESNRPPSRDETILRYGNLITAAGRGISSTPTWVTECSTTSSPGPPARPMTIS